MPPKSDHATARRKALGRGLDALLPGKAKAELPSKAAPEVAVPGRDQVRRIPLDRIDPNPRQPRRIFRRETIEELAQSIQFEGLIQPIVVSPNGNRFTLVVGERRCRAARLAGMTEIPALVQDIEPDKILEVTLVENIQREDLNPIELALALNEMVQQLGLSHEEVAARTGKDRTTITNLLRLLKLPADIQELVAERRISMGHARALLALEDPDQQRLLAEKTAAQGLSVRQVERTVRALNEPRRHQDHKRELDPNVAAAIEQMQRALGTRVRLVQRTNDKGRIEIEYYSAEDLERIYSIIVRE